MQIFKIGKKEALKLLVGDVVVLIISLVLALIFRNGELVVWHTLALNLYAFTPVFALWVVGFYIYNLYGRSTVSTQKNLPTMLFQASIFNILVAVVYFYIVSIRGITPKMTLILMFLVSYLLMYVWRLHVMPRISGGQYESVLIVGKSPEHEELLNELNSNSTIRVHATLYEGKESAALKEELRRLRVKVVILDIRGSRAEELFKSFTPEEILKLRFVNPAWLYEELFGRIPLSHVTNTWLFTHVTYEQKVYDAMKRIIDVVVAALLGIVSLIFYPFVAIAITLDDNGPIFIRQTRIGRGVKPIKIIKFRSMSADDNGHYETGATKLVVTTVGKFLRASRLDELPQLWNVLKGDLSLVGPRPELVPLAEQYAQEIPFYHVRHLIAPGLAGWAQIHQIANATDPHHGTAVAATREKLSYDFYYLKHRSLMLDIAVLLKTIKIMLSRPGS